jgi:hypothetical protein
MSNTDYQKRYYDLAAAELGLLLQTSNLSLEARDQVREYIDHNELGLAFGVIREQSTETSDQFQVQIDILSKFLKA